jgi:hypothetical protein
LHRVPAHTPSPIPADPNAMAKRPRSLTTIAMLAEKEAPKNASGFSEAYFEAFQAQYGTELTGLLKLESEMSNCTFCKTPGSGGICGEHMEAIRCLKEATGAKGTRSRRPTFLVG